MDLVSQAASVAGDGTSTIAEVDLSEMLAEVAADELENESGDHSETEQPPVQQQHVGATATGSAVSSGVPMPGGSGPSTATGSRGPFVFRPQTETSAAAVVQSVEQQIANLLQKKRMQFQVLATKSQGTMEAQLSTSKAHQDEYGRMLAVQALAAERNSTLQNRGNMDFMFEQIGRIGEAQAQTYLRSMGYDVLWIKKKTV